MPKGATLLGFFIFLDIHVFQKFQKHLITLSFTNKELSEENASYDPYWDLYHITYDDNDKEELDLEEVKKYKIDKATNNIAGENGTSYACAKYIITAVFNS